jgi:toxin-antitoxin system PIN domain toxin
MSVYLFDINLLVALLWTNHEQHAAARGWFKLHERAGWATTPFTQAGFVRISSNPRIFPDAPPPRKALDVLKANLSTASHHFWKDDIPFARAIAPFEERLNGHQQITDAYLFGLAIHKRGVLATFDASVGALVAKDSTHLKSLELLGM